MFSAGQTRRIGLLYAEGSMYVYMKKVLSRFDTARVTDGRTDGQTELLYQYRASAFLTRDKN